MALALTVRFDFVDATGKKSFTEVNVPTGFTIIGYLDFAAQMGQLLADVSGCQLTSASLNVALDFSAAVIKSTANTLADVAEKAHYIFSSAVSGFRRLFRIPTRLEVDEVVGSDDMNQADVGQAFFIALLETGASVTGGTVGFTDAYHNDLVSIASARTVLMTTA
jgi:hypothetical protein